MIGRLQSWCTVALSKHTTHNIKAHVKITVHVKLIYTILISTTPDALAMLFIFFLNRVVIVSRLTLIA